MKPTLHCALASSEASLASPARRTFMVASSALAAAATTASQTSHAQDKPAPKLQGTLLSGQEFSLAEQAGKITLVHFWASWCGSCIEEMPDMQALFVAHKTRGLKIINVSIDDELKDATDWLKTRSYTMDFAWKGAVKHSFGRLSSVPRTFVIGKDGRRLKTYRGGLDDEEIAEIVALLA